MRGNALRAQPLSQAEVPRAPWEEHSAQASIVRPEGWNPENFAREQIRGLVRQVFFSGGARPVRQVVFSAVEAETEIWSICRQVAEVLALETTGRVAVTGRNRPISIRRGSLWLVQPEMTDDESGDDSFSASALHSHLQWLRAEFEYSVVEGPPAGESHEAAAMAQFADGIILVLSAQRTRRAAALKAKESLERVQARMLGTILSDRLFPVPEAIYRRL
jgi:hypothetical protein